MYSNCDERGSHQSDGIIGEEQFDGDSVVTYECKNVNRKVQKVAATIDVEEIVRRLNQIITALKHHIHIKHIQHTKFNSLKPNLQGNEVLIQTDYSENYAN